MLLDSRELYDCYQVVIRIRERLDGGIPKSPELIKGWVAAKTKFDDEITQKLAEEHLPDIEAVAEGKAEGMWTGFKAREGRPYIETRQVKAMFREAASMLRITVDKKGSKQILQHGFEVKGEDLGSRIFLEDHSEIENEERAIHVMTPQGKRNALKRTDFVAAATLRFEIWALKTKPQEKRHVGEKEIRRMLAFSQENGLGANRSQGSGKFDVIEFGAM